MFKVEEILQFPDDYHTKGVLSLPYGDIVEPFEAWYSKTKKMSRIDYYDGKLNCAIFYDNSRDCSLSCNNGRRVKGAVGGGGGGGTVMTGLFA